MFNEYLTYMNNNTLLGAIKRFIARLNIKRYLRKRDLTVLDKELYDKIISVIKFSNSENIYKELIDPANMSFKYAVSMKKSMIDVIVINRINGEYNFTIIISTPAKEYKLQMIKGKDSFSLSYKMPDYDENDFVSGITMLNAATTNNDRIRKELTEFNNHINRLVLLCIK